ncbi:hypothetical protein KSP39_PZI003925 [Platanthera zijinensis]|uniref:HTH La-type RNA-binding domain-containing protein n=1 Tax=Platanthera zijinensis TaxID=2320716 RepID=A0AAP0BUP2_9ASPA
MLLRCTDVDGEEKYPVAFTYHKGIFLSGAVLSDFIPSLTTVREQIQQPLSIFAVPISVVASFKKIKALVHNNLLLANALKTSSKLIISEDGKKVRRTQPFTESDVEELQERRMAGDENGFHDLAEQFCRREEEDEADSFN